MAWAACNQDGEESGGLGLDRAAAWAGVTLQPLNTLLNNQALESVGLYAGQPYVSHGVSFTWSPSYSVVPDNFQAAGQTIPITPLPNANTLAFLGAATHGNASGTATMTYTDGTTQTFTLGFADWNTSSISSLPYGNSVAASMSYHNFVSGQQTINTYVFETEVTLQATKTVQSVTLPTTVTEGQLHVFSVGTRSGPYNNASTSDDAQPTFANYDGSYSAQALQAVEVTAGQTITVSGTSFIWPNAPSGFLHGWLKLELSQILSHHNRNTNSRIYQLSHHNIHLYNNHLSTCNKGPCSLLPC